MQTTNSEYGSPIAYVTNSACIRLEHVRLMDCASDAFRNETEHQNTLLVFKPVLEAPLPCAFCLSLLLSDAPDSTSQPVGRSRKIWVWETCKM